MQGFSLGECWHRSRECYLLRGMEEGFKSIVLVLQLGFRLPQLRLQAALVSLAR